MNIVKSITSDNNTSEEATINSLKLSMQWESINWFKVEKEVSKLQSRIVKATIKKIIVTANSVVSLKWLELYDGKLSRTVLMGERQSDLPDLPGKVCFGVLGLFASHKQKTVMGNAGFYSNYKKPKYLLIKKKKGGT